MIFAVPGHIEKILSGEKTQTRRRFEEGDDLHIGLFTWMDRNNRTHWMVGHGYAIQPGRGKKSVGDIEILSLRKERVGDISEADALAEGGYTRQEYLDLWQKMYKVDPAQDWCWVISFRLVGNGHA